MPIKVIVKKKLTDSASLKIIDSIKIESIDNQIKTASPEIKEELKVKKSNGFIADKVGDYFLDDNKCIWNEKAELVGCHENNKIYLYTEVKKKINIIKQKISFINI